MISRCILTTCVGRTEFSKFMLFILSFFACLTPIPSKSIPTSSSSSSHHHHSCGVFHTWSYEHNTCVGLVNTSCARGGLCIPHSFCNNDDWCECDKNYSATSDRKCMLAYGSPCDPRINSNEYCNMDQLLTCNYMSKVCNCTFFNQMTYDEVEGKCRMLLDEPCDPSDSSYYHHELGRPKRDCVQGAICKINNNKNKIGKCVPMSAVSVDDDTQSDEKVLHFLTNKLFHFL